MMEKKDQEGKQKQGLILESPRTPKAPTSPKTTTKDKILNEIRKRKIRILIKTMNYFTKNIKKFYKF